MQRLVVTAVTSRTPYKDSLRFFHYIKQTFLVVSAVKLYYSVQTNRSNQEMEELQITDLMKIQYQRAWNERWTFGQRDTNFRFPQIHQERRIGHEKKPRCSGTTASLRLPDIGNTGDSFTD
ncbi:hypothetical protein SRHO_G00217270 [Serrasalmus rhombeus]